MVKIKKLKFSIEHFDSPLLYELTFGDNNNENIGVYAESLLSGGYYTIKRKEYISFEEQIFKIIEDWKHTYATDPGIMDEPRWTLTIIFENNKKTYYRGGVACPSNFEEFENFLKGFYNKVTNE